MNDALGLLAEIATAFTGFAALVSAFGKAPSEADQRLDRVRLRNLVELGVVVVLSATLPMVLFQSGSSGDWVWTLGSVLLLVLTVAFFFIHGRRVRAVRVEKLTGYSRSGELLLWALGSIILGVLLCGLAVPSFVSRAQAYLATMWLMTAMLGVYFIRIAASLLTHKFSDGKATPK
jgi:hypothetical protein